MNIKEIVLPITRSPNEIIVDSDVLSEELKNCVGVKREIIGIFRPSEKQQVCELVKLAGQHKFSIYTFSTGNNWGYGTKNPVKSGCLLLDLSQLRSIQAVDEVLGTVEVDPGVTQQDLYDYLTDNALDFVINTTGAGPACSIIGNSLEKGFGIGKYPESLEQLVSLEVVMPSGEVINTGYGHFENTKLKHVRSYGLGPELQGMFIQSNLGIVISAVIKLQKKPEYYELVTLKSNDTDGLILLVDELRELKSAEVITNPVQIFDKHRLISVLGEKPSVQRKTISQDKIDYLSRKFNLYKWNAFFILTGSKQMVSIKKAEVKKMAKRSHIEVQFISEKRLRILTFFAPLGFLLKGIDVRPLVASLTETFHFYGGKPFLKPLYSCYYRNTQVPISFNPAKENCGYLWVSPVCPAKGEEALKVYRILRKLFDEFEFDLFLTINLLSTSQITNIVGLAYNKDSEEETARAFMCHKEAIRILEEHGYYSYRLGVENMESYIHANDPYWQVIKKIKIALDPDNVLSPGRYCPD